ncbi:MAG: glycosyltransferase [Pseudomonadota bacterium]
MPRDLFAAKARAVNIPDASIIIPIFNAAHLVQELFANLTETLPTGQHVIIVNDGSNDPQIAPLIETFAKDWPNTRVLNHGENRGFAAAVNSGLQKLPPKHHAILLNTDAIPPKGWLPRLVAPLGTAPDIATVTPLSNNAEILSVPRAGIETAPDTKLIAQLDEVAQRLRPHCANVPTGVGFCMALNRRYLDLLGGFDAAYGRGYGEEVDWCCAASAKGGRHVVTTNLVVGHIGHASFGARERTARVAKSSRLIAERYPQYPTAALDWEARDPIGPERLALALAWIAERAHQPVPVFIGHALGGGAETAMRREVSECLSRGLPGVIILRVGGPLPLRIELQGERFALAGDIDHLPLLDQLLDPVRRRRVIYSCGVHAADPLELPDMLCRLAKGQSLEVRMHDYFPISPSWNLLNGQGRFAGVPPLDTKDAVHGLAPRGSQPGVSHRTWRAAWARALSQADEITVFSRSSAALVGRAYPDTQPKIRLRPHATPDLPAAMRPGGQAIGVLGGINLAKGGQVLVDLAASTTRRIAVIGEMDGQFRLPQPNIVHGSYNRADITRLAKRYNVGVWLVPSVCPETFSFATHEVLTTGLPVVCFDLGAQAEAVRAAKNGHVLTCGPEEVDRLSAVLEGLIQR